MPSTPSTGTLDLIQAATVAEFDDDPQAVERLIVAAARGQFDHAVAQVRMLRETAAGRAAAAYTEQGYQVLDERAWAPAPSNYLHVRRVE